MGIHVVIETIRQIIDIGKSGLLPTTNSRTNLQLQWLPLWTYSIAQLFANFGFVFLVSRATDQRLLRMYISRRPFRTSPFGSVWGVQFEGVPLHPRMMHVLHVSR